MFKYVRINLDRSETTKFALDVAPWEVPILAAVNGGDRISVLGETIVHKQLPSAGVEFDRLALKYKDDPSSKRSYVSLVYGEGQIGVAALAREIAKAKESAKVAPVQSAEYDAKDDPMLGLFDGEQSSLAEATELTE